jgi:hypothetical protein
VIDPEWGRELGLLAAALTAAELPGGPAHRIAADYAPPGGGKGGGKGGKGKGGGSGRKVASKAGEKRYGLPIGTPLGQGRASQAKGKDDPDAQRAYAQFMSAQTPADLRRNATWMSTKDLSKAAKALFSFDSDNERDQAARMALVRELADRGINPAQFGYRGAPVVLNPNPKPDPTTREAEKAKKDAARLKKAADKEKAREVKRDADRTARENADLYEKVQQADAEAARTREEAKAGKAEEQRAADERRKIVDEAVAQAREEYRSTQRFKIR